MMPPADHKRELDDGARRVAFWIAAPVVVATIIGLAALPPPHRSAQRPLERAARPLVATVQSPPAPVSPHTPALDDHARAQALARATPFAAALVRYESGRMDRRSRRILRTTSAPELRGRLRLQPRLHRASASRYRVMSVELGEPNGADGITAMVTVDRDGHLSPFELALRRDRGTWLVSEIR
jgi:hypothetical protein